MFLFNKYGRTKLIVVDAVVGEKTAGWKIRVDYYSTSSVEYSSSGATVVARYFEVIK